MNARLTVITPVFDGVRHIVQCLDNVRSQGREDVEHLLVDGGSTDGTVEAIGQRMGSDPRVRLLHGPDRGQSHAMNKGIVHASGGIIGFLNVDDEYRPGTLDLAIDALSGRPEPSFLWGACEIRSERTGSVRIQSPGRLIQWRMAAGTWFEPYPYNPSSYFYHRSLHEVAGLYLEREHYAMDAEFLLRAAPFVKEVISEPAVLGVFNCAIGTKTEIDSRDGASAERLRRIMSDQRERLPLADRVRLVGHTSVRKVMNRVRASAR